MKGTVIMPDIKTALQNALSKAASAPTPQIPAAWDDEGADAAIETITTKAKEAAMPKKYFQTTNNVTRSTFNYVKNNPGNTRTQITAALEMQGFKPNSTTSLVAQMIRQGHMRETNGAARGAHQEREASASVRPEQRHPFDSNQRCVECRDLAQQPEHQASTRSVRRAAHHLRRLR